ncbi:hypothetical protein TGME49_326500, partial [Toxoplasma gondii ME49]
MPKNLNLWGKYLRLVGRGARRGFKKWQVIPPIPVKAYGREPSAASQTGLYHDEDFNYHTKRTFSMRRTRRKIKVSHRARVGYSPSAGRSVDSANFREADSSPATDRYKHCYHLIRAIPFHSEQAPVLCFMSMHNFTTGSPSE